MTRVARIGQWLLVVALGSSCLDEPSRRSFGPGPSGERLRELYVRPTPGHVENLSRAGVDAERLYVSMFDGSIAAFDRRSGLVQWQSGTSVFSPSSVEAALGRVLFANESAVALDATTGDTVWNVALPRNAYLGTTAVVGGDYFVGSDTLLFAIEIATGTVRWAKSLGTFGPFSKTVRGVVASGDTLFVALTEFLVANGLFARQHVVAIGADSGEVLWRAVVGDATTKRGTVFEPVVGKDVVIISDFWGKEVVGFDRATGAVRYRISNADEYWAGPFEAPVISGDTAYGGSGDGWVTAFDASTGDIHWRTEVGGSISSVVLCGAFLVAQDLSSILVDRRTGKLIERTFHQPPSDPLLTRFSRRGNTLYVAGREFLYAFSCG